jgi:hypothetical protein
MIFPVMIFLSNTDKDNTVQDTIIKVIELVENKDRTDMSKKYPK